MADNEKGSSNRPSPVTASGDTERPEGLAFDVEPDADLTGVPTGDQKPSHPGAAHTERTVRESGDGVGLAVPGDHSTESADDSVDEHGDESAR